MGYVLVCEDKSGRRYHSGPHWPEHVERWTLYQRRHIGNRVLYRLRVHWKCSSLQYTVQNTKGG